MPSTGTASPIPGIAPSSATAEAVAVSDLSFGFRAVRILHGVTVSVPTGCFFSLLGPSGCGKTTLLKLIGGYLQPEAGRILLRGRDVTGSVPETRNVGMVFQNYALFPHLSVRGNVAFGLEVRGLPRSVCRTRVEAMLDLVGIASAERDRKPSALSGGQQQRVALARALVIRPDLLLLDEPLANLDRHLREQLRNELRRLQRETGVTAILVTHDQEEAMAISDRIGVMAAGRLLQIGTPMEIYARPRTPFVARFLGEANLIDSPHGKSAVVRPEQFLFGEAAASCDWQREGRIVSVSFLGADILADVLCADGTTLRIRSRSGVGWQPGQSIRVGVPESARQEIPEADAE